MLQAVCQGQVVASGVRWEWLAGRASATVCIKLESHAEQSAAKHHLWRYSLAAYLWVVLMRSPLDPVFRFFEAHAGAFAHQLDRGDLLVAGQQFVNFCGQVRRDITVGAGWR